VATLENDSGAMRLSLRILAAPPAPGAPGPGEAGPALAVVAVEHLDRRDREWWPFVRLPAIHLGSAAVEGLVAALREILSGASPGFAWQSSERGPLALQLGRGPEAGALVEVAIDLGPWLADVAAVQPGSEACLFRFAAGRAGLVRFADGLAAEMRGGEGAVAG